MTLVNGDTAGIGDDDDDEGDRYSACDRLLTVRGYPAYELTDAISNQIYTRHKTKKSLNNFAFRVQVGICLTLSLQEKVSLLYS